MKSRLLLLVAVCLAAQLISLSAQAQNGNYRKPNKSEGGATKTSKWLNHGSKNVNHWVKGTSKKINKGTNKASKKVNHTIQGKK